MFSQPDADVEQIPEQPGEQQQAPHGARLKALLTEDQLSDRVTDEDFARLQVTTLEYYLHETNPANGLVRDKTAPGTPASIAAVGLALATLP